jgi:23S rRNA (adenine1618-N6)-methyltransferase
MCNPPFHASLAEAQAGTQRKWKNLSNRSSRALGKHDSKNSATALNFGGQATELYCVGGEVAFIEQMVSESQHFASQCLWFSTLVSKAANLPSVYRALKKVNVLQVKTIDMAQGQKKSRIIAWTFHQGVV